MTPRSRAVPVTFETVRRLALGFPGVEEGTSYGTQAFRVRGKFLARLREDGESLAIKCGFEERDYRIQADPKTFFTTGPSRCSHAGWTSKPADWVSRSSPDPSGFML